jgi:hypothetical protein
MSFRTHGAVALIAILLSSQLGFADENSDAQADLNRALNDYYHAMKQSRDKSPAEMKKLSEDIVQPANRNAIHAGQKKAQSDLTKAAHDAAGGGTVKANMGKTPDSDTTYESRKEDPTPIMDAKDVPAELVFPGAPKVAPSPQPSPQKSRKSR